MTTIKPWANVVSAATTAAVERIFFAASGTQAFASDEARAAFKERWLGRYLLHDAAHGFVAVGDDGAIEGYLVGSLDDPAQTERFGDIEYFAIFSEITARYPAHLHVNLDARARSQGTGSALVEAFCDHAREAGSRGVHVVTGRSARNAGFYERLGFYERGTTKSAGHAVVLLGRDLGTE